MERIPSDAWKSWATEGWHLFQSAAFALMAIHAAWLALLAALPAVWQVVFGQIFGFFVSGLLILACHAKHSKESLLSCWSKRKATWMVSGLGLGVVFFALTATLTASGIGLSMLLEIPPPTESKIASWTHVVYRGAGPTILLAVAPSVGWAFGLSLLSRSSLLVTVRLGQWGLSRALVPGMAFTLLGMAWSMFTIWVSDVAIVASPLVTGWIHACLYVSLRHVFLNEPPKKRQPKTKAAPAAAKPVPTTFSGMKS